jgi:drug/metabolite transporter (DMT)-like permease
VALILALGSALVYGVADYCGGRAARAAPSIVVTVVAQVVSLALATAIVLVVGTPIPPSDQLLWGAVAGLASAFALVSFYQALSTGSMTVVAPITAVLSAVLPVVWGVVGGERPAALAYVGMAVAVVAVALVSGVASAHGVRTPQRTIGLACIAGVGFALIFVALGQTSDESGMWPLVAARVVSVLLLAAVVAGVRTSRRIGGAAGLAVTAGILDMLANVLFLLGVRQGLLSIVAVITALYPVSTVALAFALDRERVSRSQTVGIAMAVTALVLVTASGSA